MTTSAAPTMGVEEEYFLVDPASRTPQPAAAAARAARDGWSGCGVDALTGQILPTSAQIVALLDFVGPALRRHGDTETVLEFVDRLTGRGTGSELQRAALARHGRFAGVVDDLVRLTART